MKKLRMLVAIVAAFASCQSNNKKNAEMVMEDDGMMVVMPEPIEVDEEIFTGTRPAADGPGIDFVLTLGAATDGVDTIYDIYTARKDGIVPSNYFVWWGMEDKYLFQYAKQELTEISQQDQLVRLLLLSKLHQLPAPIGRAVDIRRNQ